MPGDGSLVRLRLDPGDDGRVLRQRVVDPGEGSDYTSWTNWGVKAYAIALASIGSRLAAFTLAKDGRLYRSESSDCGANWGIWLDMGNVHATDVHRLAACFKSADEALVVFGDGGSLFTRLLSGGEWQRTWVSPTSHGDPSGAWYAEEAAYDGDCESDAYNSPVMPDSWGDWLELVHNPLLCDRVRFLAAYDEAAVNAIDLDVYDPYAGTWIDVYEGAYSDRAWEEKQLDQERTITKARLRFYNDSAVAQPARLYEFEFETPYVEWANSLAAVTGVALAHSGDWNVMVSGSAAGSLETGIWTCVFGDGHSAQAGVWTALNPVSLAAPDSGVAFGCPALHAPDVYRAFFVEAFSGIESYSRPYWTHSLASSEYIDNRWREPVPLDLASEHGLALCSEGGYAWLTRPDGVWRTSLTPSYVDLSADVTYLKAVTTETGGAITVALRNEDGRYGSVGTQEQAAIALGSGMTFSPGYVTSEGQEVSDGPAFWIDGWKQALAAGVAGFTLHAVDGWGLLEQWNARNQFAWTAGDKTILDLLAFVLARSGLNIIVSSSSDALTSQRPAFTISPGESGKTAVLRLLAMVPDTLLFRGATGLVVYPRESDLPVYDYGTGHSILNAAYETRSCEPNRVQVFGNGVFAEKCDWPELELVFDRLEQVHDLNLDTVEKAQARAEAVLRNAQMHGLSGRMLVPMNCGQEMYDVIVISDAVASLAQARKARIGPHARV